MTTLTTIPKFPAGRVDAARDALEAAHGRLVRGAARTGQVAPAAPELVVAREFAIWTCRKCGDQGEGLRNRCGRPEHECGGPAKCSLFVDLELRAERPALAGWEFLAVVEPLVGGNLLRQVPGASVEDGELNRWRQGALECDHCHTIRNRAETFIVRADGSDPAVPVGTYKQVGRNCLQAFLGGRSAAEIVARLGWRDLVVGCAGDGEGSGGGSGEPVWEPELFMSWAAAAVRVSGFVSRAQARDSYDGTQSTSDLVCELLTPPWGDAAYAKWRALCDRYRPTAEDTTRGAAALEWARALPESSDYERNLKLVATQPIVVRNRAGILASAIAAHAKFLGEQVKRSSRGTTSDYLGAVGDKKRDFGAVTVERVVAVDTNYGPMFIHTFRDAAGNVIVWRTSEAKGEPGQTYNLIGTVKAHTEFRGERQTEATRCKLDQKS